MKVSKEQVAAHRARILAAAARLFRLRGFDDVTVAEVMKDAGLTHGAFYGHFSSKEALIAEAIGQALAPPPEDAKTRAPAVAYADGYLSVEHRDGRATGCSFSSLGTEAARGSVDLRRIMTKSTRRQIDRFSAEADGGSAPRSGAPQSPRGRRWSARWCLPALSTTTSCRRKSWPRRARRCRSLKAKRSAPVFRPLPQALMKAKTSALIVSAWVVGMPWGKSL